MRYTSEFEHLEHDAFTVLRTSLQGTKYPKSTIKAAMFVLKTLGYNSSHFAKEREEIQAYHKAENNDNLLELYYSKVLRGIDPWHASDEAGYVTGGYDLDTACTSRTCTTCNDAEQIALYKRYEEAMRAKQDKHYYSKLNKYCRLTEEYVAYIESSKELKEE